MKKIILILLAIFLMSFIGLTLTSEPNQKEPISTVVLDEEPYVDDIPFDTKSVVDSLKNNN